MGKQQNSQFDPEEYKRQYLEKMSKKTGLAPGSLYVGEGEDPNKPSSLSDVINRPRHPLNSDGNTAGYNGNVNPIKAYEDAHKATNDALAEEQGIWRYGKAAMNALWNTTTGTLATIGAVGEDYWNAAKDLATPEGRALRVAQNVTDPLHIGTPHGMNNSTKIMDYYEDLTKNYKDFMHTNIAIGSNEPIEEWTIPLTEGIMSAAGFAGKAKVANWALGKGAKFLKYSPKAAQDVAFWGTAGLLANEEAVTNSYEETKNFLDKRKFELKRQGIDFNTLPDEEKQAIKNEAIEHSAMVYKTTFGTSLVLNNLPLQWLIGAKGASKAGASFRNTDAGKKVGFNWKNFGSGLAAEMGSEVIEETHPIFQTNLRAYKDKPIDEILLGTLKSDEFLKTLVSTIGTAGAMTGYGKYFQRQRENIQNAKDAEEIKKMFGFLDDNDSKSQQIDFINKTYGSMLSLERAKDQLDQLKAIPSTDPEHLKKVDEYEKILKAAHDAFNNNIFMSSAQMGLAQRTYDFLANLENTDDPTALNKDFKFNNDSEKEAELLRVRNEGKLGRERMDLITAANDEIYNAFEKAGIDNNSKEAIDQKNSYIRDSILHPLATKEYDAALREHSDKIENLEKNSGIKQLLSDYAQSGISKEEQDKVAELALKPTKDIVKEVEKNPFYNNIKDSILGKLEVAAYKQAVKDLNSTRKTVEVVKARAIKDGNDRIKAAIDNTKKATQERIKNAFVQQEIDKGKAADKSGNPSVLATVEDLANNNPLSSQSENNPEEVADKTLSDPTKVGDNPVSKVENKVELEAQGQQTNEDQYQDLLNDTEGPDIFDQKKEVDPNYIPTEDYSDVPTSYPDPIQPTEPEQPNTTLASVTVKQEGDDLQLETVTPNLSNAIVAKIYEDSKYLEYNQSLRKVIAKFITVLQGDIKAANKYGVVKTKQVNGVDTITSIELTEKGYLDLINDLLDQSAKLPDTQGLLDEEVAEYKYMLSIFTNMAKYSKGAFEDNLIVILDFESDLNNLHYDSGKNQILITSNYFTANLNLNTNPYSSLMEELLHYYTERVPTNKTVAAGYRTIKQDFDNTCKELQQEYLDALQDKVDLSNILSHINTVFGVDITNKPNHHIIRDIAIALQEAANNKAVTQDMLILWNAPIKVSGQDCSLRSVAQPFQSTAEFVGAGLTNPTSATIMKGYYKDKRNVFSKFVDAIEKYFNDLFSILGISKIKGSTYTKAISNFINYSKLMGALPGQLNTITYATATQGVIDEITKDIKDLSSKTKRNEALIDFVRSQMFNVDPSGDPNQKQWADLIDGLSDLAVSEEAKNNPQDTDGKNDKQAIIQQVVTGVVRNFTGTNKPAIVQEKAEISLEQPLPNQPVPIPVNPVTPSQLAHVASVDDQKINETKLQEVKTKNPSRKEPRPKAYKNVEVIEGNTVIRTTTYNLLDVMKEVIPTTQVDTQLMPQQVYAGSIFVGGAERMENKDLRSDGVTNLVNSLSLPNKKLTHSEDADLEIIENATQALVHRGFIVPEAVKLYRVGLVSNPKVSIFKVTVICTLDKEQIELPIGQIDASKVDAKVSGNPNVLKINAGSKYSKGFYTDTHGTFGKQDPLRSDGTTGELNKEMFDPDKCYGGKAVLRYLVKFENNYVDLITGEKVNTSDTFHNVSGGIANGSLILGVLQAFENTNKWNTTLFLDSDEKKLSAINDNWGSGKIIEGFLKQLHDAVSLSGNEFETQRQLINKSDFINRILGKPQGFTNNLDKTKQLHLKLYKDAKTYDLSNPAILISELNRLKADLNNSNFAANTGIAGKELNLYVKRPDGTFSNESVSPKDYLTSVLYTKLIERDQFQNPYKDKDTQEFRNNFNSYLTIKGKKIGPAYHQPVFVGLDLSKAVSEESNIVPVNQQADLTPKTESDPIDPVSKKKDNTFNVFNGQVVDLKFDEDKHEYTYSINGSTYTPATSVSIIKKDIALNPFNSKLKQEEKAKEYNLNYANNPFNNLQKITAEDIDKVWKRQTALGTATHKIIETWLDKKGIIVPSEYSEYYTQKEAEALINALKSNKDLMAVLAQPGNTFYSEQMLVDPNFYEGVPIAGTADLIIKTADDKYIIVDWKSDQLSDFKPSFNNSLKIMRYIGPSNVLKGAVSKALESEGGNFKNSNAQGYFHKLNEYGFQLSVYEQILKNQGKDVINKIVVHIPVTKNNLEVQVKSYLGLKDEKGKNFRLQRTAHVEAFLYTSTNGLLPKYNFATPELQEFITKNVQDNITKIKAAAAADKIIEDYHNDIMQSNQQGTPDPTKDQSTQTTNIVDKSNAEKFNNVAKDPEMDFTFSLGGAKPISEAVEAKLKKLSHRRIVNNNGEVLNPEDEQSLINSLTFISLQIIPDSVKSQATILKFLDAKLPIMLNKIIGEKSDLTTEQQEYFKNFFGAGGALMFNNEGKPLKNLPLQLKVLEAISSLKGIPSAINTTNVSNLGVINNPEEFIDQLDADYESETSSRKDFQEDRGFSTDSYKSVSARLKALFLTTPKRTPEGYIKLTPGGLQTVESPTKIINSLREICSRAKSAEEFINLLDILTGNNSTYDYAGIYSYLKTPLAILKDPDNKDLLYQTYVAFSKFNTTYSMFSEERKMSIDSFHDSGYKQASFNVQTKLRSLVSGATTKAKFEQSKATAFEGKAWEKAISILNDKNTTNLSDYIQGTLYNLMQFNGVALWEDPENNPLGSSRSKTMFEAGIRMYLDFVANPLNKQGFKASDKEKLQDLVKDKLVNALDNFYNPQATKENKSEYFVDNNAAYLEDYFKAFTGLDPGRLRVSKKFNKKSIYRFSSDSYLTKVVSGKIPAGINEFNGEGPSGIKSISFSRGLTNKKGVVKDYSKLQPIDKLGIAVSSFLNGLYTTSNNLLYDLPSVTLSDKTTKPFYKVTAENYEDAIVVGENKTLEFSLSTDKANSLIDIANNEAGRIRYFKGIWEALKAKGYSNADIATNYPTDYFVTIEKDEDDNIVGGSQGAGFHHIALPFLDSFRDVDQFTQPVREELAKEFETVIRDEVEEFAKRLDAIQFFQDYQVEKEDGSKITKYKSGYLTNKLTNSLVEALEKKGINVNTNNLGRYLAMQYVPNYMVNQYKALALTSDPATNAKKWIVSNNPEDFNASMDRLVVNFVKRAAKLIAPANAIAWNSEVLGDLAPGETDFTFNMAVLKDNSFDLSSEERKVIRDQFGEDKVEEAYFDSIAFESGQPIEEMIKQLNSITKADASGFCTFEEALNIRCCQGKLSIEGRNALLAADEDRKLTAKLLKEHGFQLSLIKPVIIGITKEGLGGLNIDNNVYGKFAEYPLTKTEFAGTRLGKLYDWMMDKNNNVQRVIFESALKEGAVAGKILSAADLINNPNPKELVYKVDRKYYGIQLDPQDAPKLKVKEGSQARKLGLNNLLLKPSDSFNLRTTGDSITNQEFVDNFRALQQRLFDLRKQKFEKTMSFDGDLKMFTKIGPFQSQLVKSIASNSGNETILDTINLDETGKQLEVPLFANPYYLTIANNAGAMFESKLGRPELPGLSGSQISEHGIVSMDSDPEGITYLDGKKRERLYYQRKIYRSNGEYYIKTEAGKVPVTSEHPMWSEHHINNGAWNPSGTTGEEVIVLPTQVIVPFFFEDENGKSMDIGEFKSFTEEGKYDIDPELLQLYGFRVPFGEKSFGCAYEIVGFLPSTSTQVAILSELEALFKGSDNDYDKLTFYRKNYILNDLGKLVVNNGQLNEGSEYTKEATENEIVDYYIQSSLIPDQFMHQITPSSIKDLKSAADEFEKSEKDFSALFEGSKGSKTSLILPSVQAKSDKQNSESVAGTGIFANSTAMIMKCQVNSGGVENRFPITKVKLNNTDYTSIKYIGTGDNNPKMTTQFLSAALDGVKDQMLGKIGAGQLTFGYYNLWAFLTVYAGTKEILIKDQFKVAIDLINQPIIKDYLELLNSKKNPTVWEKDEIRERTINRFKGALEALKNFELKEKIQGIKDIELNEVDPTSSKIPEHVIDATKLSKLSKYTIDQFKDTKKFIIAFSKSPDGAKGGSAYYDLVKSLQDQTNYLDLFIYQMEQARSLSTYIQSAKGDNYGESSSPYAAKNQKDSYDNRVTLDRPQLDKNGNPPPGFGSPDAIIEQAQDYESPKYVRDAKFEGLTKTSEGFPLFELPELTAIVKKYKHGSRPNNYLYETINQFFINFTYSAKVFDYLGSYDRNKHLNSAGELTRLFINNKDSTEYSVLRQGLKIIDGKISVNFSIADKIGWKTIIDQEITQLLHDPKPISKETNYTNKEFAEMLMAASVLQGIDTKTPDNLFNAMPFAKLRAYFGLDEQLATLGKPDGSIERKNLTDQLLTNEFPFESLAIRANPTVFNERLEKPVRGQEESKKDFEERDKMFRDFQNGSFINKDYYIENLKTLFGSTVEEGDIKVVKGTIFIINRPEDGSEYMTFSRIPEATLPYAVGPDTLNGQGIYWNFEDTSDMPSVGRFDEEDKTSYVPDEEVVEVSYEDENSLPIYENEYDDVPTSYSLPGAKPLMDETTKVLEKNIENTANLKKNLEKQVKVESDPITGNPVNLAKLTEKLNYVDKHYQNLIQDLRGNLKDVIIAESENLTNLINEVNTTDNLKFNYVNALYAQATLLDQFFRAAVSTPGFEQNNLNVDTQLAQLAKLEGAKIRLLEKAALQDVTKNSKLGEAQIQDLAKKALDDTANIITEHFFGIQNNNHPYIQRMHQLTEITFYQANENIVEFGKEFDKEVTKYEDVFGKDYTQFWQVDSEGKATGNLVVEYKDEYYKTVRAMRDKFMAETIEKEVNGEIIKKPNYQGFEEWKVMNHTIADTATDPEAMAKLQEYEVARQNFSKLLDDKIARGEMHPRQAGVALETYEAKFDPRWVIKFKKYIEKNPGTEFPRINTKFCKLIPDKSYRDPMYDSIMSNSVAKRYYNAFRSELESIRSMLPLVYETYTDNKLPLNFIPELHRTLTDKMFKGDFNQVGASLQEKIIGLYAENTLSNRPGKYNNLVMGGDQKFIPIHMLSGIIPTEARSSNLSDILVAFKDMSEKYKAQVIIEPGLEILARSVQELPKGEKSIYVMGRSANEMFRIEKNILYFIDAVVYGREKDKTIAKNAKSYTKQEKETKTQLTEELVKLEKDLAKLALDDPNAPALVESITELQSRIDAIGKNFTYGKMIDSFLDYVRVKALGFNPKTAFLDYSVNQLNALIHFSTEEGVWQYLRKSGEAIKYMASGMNSPYYETISDYFTMEAHVGDARYSETKRTNRNKLEKAITKTSPMLFLKYSDKTAKLSLALTIMETMPAQDKDGNEIFDSAGNKLMYKDCIDKDGNILHGADLYPAYRRYNNIKTKTFGDYSSLSPLKIKKEVLGRILGMFRTWMGEAWLNRFGSYHLDTISDVETKGRWRSAVQDNEGTVSGKQLANYMAMAIGGKWLLGKVQPTTKKDLSGIDLKNAYRLRMEVGIMMGLYATANLLYSIFSSMEEDDEEEDPEGTQTKVFKMANLLAFGPSNLVKGIIKEMTYFTTPSSATELASSVAPPYRTVQEIGTMLKDFSEWARVYDADNTDNVNATLQYSKGKRKGEYRLTNSALRLIPLIHQKNVFKRLAEDPEVETSELELIFKAMNGEPTDAKSLKQAKREAKQLKDGRVRPEYEETQVDEGRR